MNLYDENGYVNHALWYQDPAPFVLALGGRGTGKTYGALLDVVAGQYGKIVYVRRTGQQIDSIKVPELNPFKAVNIATGSDLVISAMSKNVAGIYHGQVVDGVIKPSGDPLGIAVALSVFASIRGIDGSDYQTILFDEAIKENHEKPIKDEATAFLNLYESLNRNRELSGGKPMKCLILANSNDLRGAILDALGVVDIIDSMLRKGQEFKRCRNGMLSIYLYQNSPISGMKAKSALYQIANNHDFAEMALDNKFSYANYERVASRPLREYFPLVSIGDITVYQNNADSDSFYVVDGIKAQEQYTTYPVSLKAFKADYFYLYEALLDKRLYYASASVKIRFERIWSF